MTLRQEVIDILKIKNNEVGLQIIEVIDIFNEQELLELKTILSQENPEKLKEALLYKHSLFQKTMDKIIELQREFAEIKNKCNEKIKKQESTKLDKQLNNLLDTI